ncbi:MAG: hypothetical protein H6594_11230 [Flavobacteriales bacterium]|nr:hypothetical protein [Flavobacteriales bacterium]
MPSPDAIEELTRAVLARLNDDLPAADRFPTDPSTPILGDGGVLDSLGVANFIVGMEEAVERAFGAPVSLSDQDLMGLFAESTVTVRSFAAFLSNRLNT